MGSACQTLASVHGVSLLRLAFTLLLISPSSPTGSAEIGMIGKMLHLPITTCFQYIFKYHVCQGKSFNVMCAGYLNEHG